MGPVGVAWVRVQIGGKNQGAGAVLEVGTTTESRLTLLRRGHHDRAAREYIHGISCDDTLRGQGCESCSHNHHEDRRGVARPY